MGAVIFGSLHSFVKTINKKTISIFFSLKKHYLLLLPRDTPTLYLTIDLHVNTRRSFVSADALIYFIFRKNWLLLHNIREFFPFLRLPLRLPTSRAQIKQFCQDFAICGNLRP